MRTNLPLHGYSIQLQPSWPMHATMRRSIVYHASVD